MSVIRRAVARRNPTGQCPHPGTLAGMTALRFSIGAVIVLMGLVALLPMVVLLDLAGGGTGLGLCDGGLAGCRTSYFDGPELLGLLVLVLLLLGVLLRTLLRVRAALDAGSGGDRRRGP